MGRGPRVVVSTAAFHAKVHRSFPALGGLKETKMFLPHPLVKLSIVGNLRDREIMCSASDRQGLNFKSCVWRAVSSHSSHRPRERLSWSNLACMCTKVAQSPIHFISFTDHFTIQIAAINKVTSLTQVKWPETCYNHNLSSVKKNQHAIKTSNEYDILLGYYKIPFTL